LARDVTFQLFRARQLSEAFAGKIPVYLIEVVLHRSTMSKNLKDDWSLVCLVNPAMRSPLLGLPAELALRTVRKPDIQLVYDQSLRAR
jgi:hypothetical protein